MRKILLATGVFLLFLCSGMAQDSRSTLNSKIDFCNREVKELETELSKYEHLLDLQNSDIQDLKMRISGLQQEIKVSEQENSDLRAISVVILNLARKFEKEGNYQSALEVYKLLIKTYPTSLEAASGKLKMDDLREESSSEKKK